VIGHTDGRNSLLNQTFQKFGRLMIFGNAEHTIKQRVFGVIVELYKLSHNKNPSERKNGG
jgi:hypothetical protein